MQDVKLPTGAYLYVFFHAAVGFDKNFDISSCQAQDVGKIFVGLLSLDVFLRTRHYGCDGICFV